MTIRQDNYSRIPGSYLRLLLVTAICTVLLVLLINRLIDPIGLYEGPSIEGVNANKPAFEKHLRLGKAEAVRRSRASTVVLGTSRTEFGVDPEHPGYRVRPVYNLGLSASNIYESYRFLMHAHTINPLTEVVLSLNFHMFNSFHREPLNLDTLGLEVSSNGVRENNHWIDNVLKLGTVDMLFSSIETVRKQSESAHYLPNGMREATNIAVNIKNEGGHRGAFQKNEMSYFNGIYKNFTFAHNRRDMLDYFSLLLKFVHQNQIVLHIYIHPSHARQLETKAATGLWPLYEEWKRHLVQINEIEAQRLGKPPFPLWDFSGYNSLTTEPVPSMGDTQTQMQWYWESSHYKKELGDLVLDRIFNHKEPGRNLPADFGFRLTSGNIEPHLERVRADRKRWRASFPEDVSEIEGLKLREGLNNPAQARVDG